MRYPASEKLEIIRLVENSPLSARRTLQKFGIPRSIGLMVILTIVLWAGVAAEMAIYLMCNLYNVTTTQQAIIEWSRAMRDLSGNLEPSLDIYPGYLAPIVRNGHTACANWCGSAGASRRHRRRCSWPRRSEPRSWRRRASRSTSRRC